MTARWCEAHGWGRCGPDCPMHPGRERGQQAAPGPATERDARGESRPLPAFHPDVPSAGARLAPGAEPEATAEPLADRWYAPGWQKPPPCGVCGTNHYAPSRGAKIACQRPGFRPYPVCPECGYTVDAVAAAEFAGRHAECSLPPADRAYFRSVVQAMARARRARRAAREEPAA